MKETEFEVEENDNKKENESWQERLLIIIEACNEAVNFKKKKHNFLPGMKVEAGAKDGKGNLGYVPCIVKSLNDDGTVMVIMEESEKEVRQYLSLLRHLGGLCTGDTVNVDCTSHGIGHNNNLLGKVKRANKDGTFDIFLFENGHDLYRIEADKIRRREFLEEGSIVEANIGEGARFHQVKVLSVNEDNSFDVEFERSSEKEPRIPGTRIRSCKPSRGPIKPQYRFSTYISPKHCILSGGQCKILKSQHGPKFSLKDCIEAGIQDMKEQGFILSDFLAEGLAEDYREDSSFDVYDLREFMNTDIDASWKLLDVGLYLKDQGIEIEELPLWKCVVDARAHGYTAKDAFRASLTVAEFLRPAGFSAEEAKEAGYSIQTIVEASEPLSPAMAHEVKSSRQKVIAEGKFGEVFEVAEYHGAVRIRYEDGTTNHDDFGEEKPWLGLFFTPVMLPWDTEREHSKARRDRSKVVEAERKRRADKKEQQKLEQEIARQKRVVEKRNFLSREIEHEEKKKPNFYDSSKEKQFEPQSSQENAVHHDWGRIYFHALAQDKNGIRGLDLNDFKTVVMELLDQEGDRRELLYSSDKDLDAVFALEDVSTVFGPSSLPDSFSMHCHAPSCFLFFVSPQSRLIRATLMKMTSTRC